MTPGVTSVVLYSNMQGLQKYFNKTLFAASYVGVEYLK
jgi:hypothetical protein